MTIAIVHKLEAYFPQCCYKYNNFCTSYAWYQTMKVSVLHMTLLVNTNDSYSTTKVRSNQSSKYSLIEAGR